MKTDQEYRNLEAENTRLAAEVERLTKERDDDRKREYGYSQQTVDALQSTIAQQAKRIKELELRAMPAIPEGYAQCPVARVTGYFDGHCVVAPLNTAVLLPVGMALFANAAPQAPVIDRDAVIDCATCEHAACKESVEPCMSCIDEVRVYRNHCALKQSPATDDGMTPNALGQGSAACGASPAPTGCASDEPTER